MTMVPVGVLVGGKAGGETSFRGVGVEDESMEAIFKADVLVLAVGSGAWFEVMETGVSSRRGVAMGGRAVGIIAYQASMFSYLTRRAADKPQGVQGHTRLNSSKIETCFHAPRRT